MSAGEISCSSIEDWVKDHKRKREEDDKNDCNVLDLASDLDLNKNLSETNHDDENNNNNNDKHEKAEQESQSGGENENEFYSKMKNDSLMRVKELHVSSAVLAGKSPHFYKLFSINGMLETEQKNITLKIDASEESAVMELLKFMYNNTLSTMTAPALLDILVVADKYQVISCMKYVSCLLLKMPITLDYALVLFDLPSNLLKADSVKPLKNAAKSFIATRYKDISKFPIDEVMALPLAAFEAILASDEIQITSEDIMYEVVLRWAKQHYPVLQQRQQILRYHLARYIRFPHMTCRRLTKILTSDDFPPSVASKVVLEALFFKAESLHKHVPINQNNRFVERVYTYKPIKIVEFEAPRQQCIVYLNLNRKDCESLYPSNRIYFQPFHIGGQIFFLTAHCNMDEQDLFQSFGLFITMQENGGMPNQNPGSDNRISENPGPNLTLEYEFSARWKPTKEFLRRYKGNHTFAGGKSLGYTNLFGMSWDYFMDKDCFYFINDVLHLRVELTVLV